MAMILPLIIMLVFYLGILGVGIAGYVMSSYGLYTIAERRQIKNSWLAWVPMANVWILGCLADDYDSRREIKTNWKKVMLALIVCGLIVIALYIIFIIAVAVGAVISEFNGSYMDADVMPAGAMGAFFGFYVVFIVVAVVVAALTACQYICMFKVFESTVPDKAIKYFILSVMVPLAYGICLMKCKDKGYSKTSAPGFVPAPEAAAEEPEAEAADVESVIEEIDVSEDAAEDAE